MLNWIFLRKFILAGSVAGLSITPLVLISKYSAWGRNQYFSEFKKRKGAYSRRFADRFGFDEFAQEIFNVDEMKAPIEGVFARDIVGNYLRKTSSTYLRNKYLEFAQKEAKDFQKELSELTNRHPNGKPAINRILDENGGTREDMIRRKLNDASYSFLKGEILDFDQKNFTLNKHYDSSQSATSFIRDSHYFSSTDLADSKNWDKIGFYPLTTRKVMDNLSLEQFEKDKFDFINWAHKRWFEEVQPFYVWMSLWKYKKNATEEELSKVWDKAKLGADFPKEASYEFPYFEYQDGSSLSTTSKFNNFLKDVVKKDSPKNNEDIYVQNLHTEDNGTSLYMEASNMYSGKWFTKFAAAANYKYQKALFNDSKDTYINEKEKSNLTFDKGGRLFDFFADGKSRFLNVDKGNIFSSSSKEKYSDAVEIKDSPWMFIRNEAGIHAVAVDSETARQKGKGNETLKNIYEHFNFRTLEVKQKEAFSLQRTLDIDYTKPITSFKEYISQNFDRLLLSYTISDSSSNNNLFKNFNLDTSRKYKNLFHEWDELVTIRTQYEKQLQLREILIKEYARSHWDTDTGNTGKVPKKMGIASPSPYKMELKKEDGQEYLFPELEKIYTLYFSKKKYGTATDIEELKRKQEQFKKTIANTLGQLELNTKISGYLQSDRIFLNNFYINEIIDSFFKNEASFRNLLMKSSLKKEYLGKSFIGNKGYVNKSGNALLIEGKFGQSSGSNDWDFLDGFEWNNQEKVEQLMSDIESHINKFYYGKYFLRNAESNAWDVLKYGVEKIDGDSPKFEEAILKVAKSSFERSYFSNVGGLKEKHHKFLATLTYLTRDNFENFLNLMQATVTPKNDAYFLWESLSKLEVKESSKGSETKLLESPWLNSDAKDLKKKIQNFGSHLRVPFSGYGKNVKGWIDNYAAKFFYKGFLVLDSFQSWIKDLVDDTSSFSSNSLYNYGKNANEVDDYVQSIQNEVDLEEVIKKIKKVAGKEAQKLNSLLDLKTVYITEGEQEQGTPKSYRILTLQERKTLISAILKKIKTQDIQDGKVKKDRYKEIFKTDPSKSFAISSSTKHQECSSASSASSCGDLIKKEHFWQKNEKVGNYYLTQISHNSFKDFDSFKKFAKLNLTKELFWAWIIDLAQNESIQEMAIKDLEDSVDKIEAYDKQFQESASYRYAK